MDALRQAPIIFTNLKGHLDTLEVKELIVQAATSSAKLLVFVRFTRVDSHAKSVDFCHFLVCQAFTIAGIALAEINSNCISILQIFTPIIAKNKRVRPAIFWRTVFRKFPWSKGTFTINMVYEPTFVAYELQLLCHMSCSYCGRGWSWACWNQCWKGRAHHFLRFFAGIW